MTKMKKRFFLVCGMVTAIGLILALVGFLTGGSSRENLSKLEEKYPWIELGGSGEITREVQELEPFSEIDLECLVGEVQLIEGDSYQVEMAYDSETHAPTVRSENGHLTVTDWPEEQEQKVYLGIFGDPQAETKITISYPAKAKLQDVTLDCDMGVVKVFDSKIKNLDLTVETGAAILKQVTAGSLTADVDMGALEGTALRMGSSDLDVHTGSIDLEGVFKGTNRIDCDMGECRVETALPQEAYALDVTADMGEVQFNGKNVSGGYTVKDKDAKHRFSIDCNTGEVSLDFQ